MELIEFFISPLLVWARRNKNKDGGALVPNSSLAVRRIFAVSVVRRLSVVRHNWN